MVRLVSHVAHVNHGRAREYIHHRCRRHPHRGPRRPTKVKDTGNLAGSSPDAVQRAGAGAETVRALEIRVLRTGPPAVDSRRGRAVTGWGTGQER